MVTLTATPAAKFPARVALQASQVIRYPFGAAGLRTPGIPGPAVIVRVTVVEVEPAQVTVGVSWIRLCPSSLLTAAPLHAAASGRVRTDRLDNCLCISFP